MKRHVLSKTTSFHVKKKRAERCRFEQHCSAFFFPWTRSRGRKKLLFFSSLILHAHLHPRVLCQTRSPTHPHDERPGEPRPASHAHWPANPTPWQGNKALLPMHSNRAAIGTPPLLLPYKYHPTPARTREREKKEGTERRERKERKGKGPKENKERKRGSWKQERGTVRDKGEGRYRNKKRNGS